MGMARACCGEWTVKQGAILVGCFTILGSILWLAWETYQLIYLQGQISGVDSKCAPNPCLHGGYCLLSESIYNDDGYVCDCWGTGFDGEKCDQSRVRSAHKRSCADWWQDGQREDGLYMIDPDGPDSPTYDPFVIRCEFTDSRAYTVARVEGESGSKYKEGEDEIVADLVNVSPHWMLYLMYHNVTQKAIDADDRKNPSSQNVTATLATIVANSHSCEQTVTWKCKKYSLETEYTGNYNLVEGADGLTYMPSGHRFSPHLGGVKAPYFCSCYVNLTCFTDDVDSPKVCNCNVENEELMTDVLVLDKKNNPGALPVAKVWTPGTVSNTDDDVDLGFEVSPLRCYDEFHVPPMHSRWATGGYSEHGSPYHGEFLQEGFTIMWGVIIAFIVVTALLLIASFVLIVAAVNDSAAPMFFWILMIILMNLMLLIVLIIRWYYLGFIYIVWEVAIDVIWIGLTFYGLFAVVAFFGMVSRGLNRD